MLVRSTALVRPVLRRLQAPIVNHARFVSVTRARLASATTDEFDAIVFPFVSNGSDPNLCWSLNMHHVSPKYNVFRNAEFKSLAAHSNGSLSKEKALVVNTDESKTPSGFLYRDPETNPERMDKVSFPSDPRFPLLPSLRYKKLFTKVTDQLRHTENLFLQDFEVQGVLVRVITDDAPTALFIKNLVGSSAVNTDPREFAANSTVVYHSAALDLLQSEVKVPSKELLALDPFFNTAILTGTASKTAVLSAISSVVDCSLALDRCYGVANRFLLNCHTVKSAGSGAIAVFGADLETIESGLLGAHAAVVSEGKLAPVFPLTSTAPSKGALVEHVKSAGRSFDRVTPQATGTSQSYDVDGVVFVVDDPTNTLPALSKLDSQQALHHFFFGARSGELTAPCFSSFPVDAEAQARSLVEDVIKTNKSHIFLINRSVAGPELPKIISALSSTTKGGKYTANKTIGLAICSQLEGLDAKSLKTSITAANVQKLAQARVKTLLDFHGTVSEEVLAGGLAQQQ